MARLLFDGSIALLLLLLVFQTSNCKDTNPCAPSCGNHNISYPFRLENDPSYCGNHNISYPFNYTLHCEKNTSTVLYLDSRKYYVQAINYNNLTIRVVDAGVTQNDCSSLPHFSLAFDSLGNSRSAYNSYTLAFTRFNYITYPYTWFQYKRTGWEWFPKYKPLPLLQMMIFINCANPVDSPLYVDTGTCLINYKSLTIRVVDPGVKENDCSSLPDFSLAFDSLGNSRREYTHFTLAFTGLDYIAEYDYMRFPYTWFQYKRTGPKWFPKYKPLPFSQMLIFINCTNPVDSPLYVDTGTCLNGEKSSNVSLLMRSYVNVGGMKGSDLMELCSLERMTLLPVKDYKSMSYKEIHSQLAYGFELSWHNSMCGSCAGICYIDDSNQTRCEDGFSWVWTTAVVLLYASILIGAKMYLWESVCDCILDL